MIWRKLLASFMIVLMCASPSFAFPHDPSPSTIDAVGGYGVGPAYFDGFIGDWTNPFVKLDRHHLLVLDYMDREFKTNGGGPGGAKDMKIWTTPSLSADKVAEETAGWNYLLENPYLPSEVGDATVPPPPAKSMIATQTEMINFIEGLPKTNMTVEYLGEIPRGFPFPMMVFSTSADRSPAGLKKTGKPLVWVQGNVHGFEWSGGESVLAMAEQLAKGTHDALLAKINVVLIPRMNPDGAKYPQRLSADTLALQWTPTPERRDLNRDHMLLDNPVTRAMKYMLSRYEPHFSVDLHERGRGGGAQISTGDDGNSVQGRFGRLVDNDSGDLGTAGATSLQLPRDFVALRYNELDEKLGKMAEEVAGVWFGLYREDPCTYAQGNENSYSTDWMTPWQQTYWMPHHPDNAAGFDGLTAGPYADSEYINVPNGNMVLITKSAFDEDAPYFAIQEAYFNPRNARNNNGMAGAISQLYENKSLTGRGMFERRIAASYIAILATMTDAAERADFWMDTLEGMRAQWIEKGKTVSEDDMVAILPLPPKPSFWGEPNPEVNYKGHNLPYMVVDVTDADAGKALDDPVTLADIAKVSSYDVTRAMKFVGQSDPEALPLSKQGAYKWVTDGSGTRDYQPFKFVYSWQGPALRERVRPYAYIMDGPYAPDGATRMALNGIEVKRLAEDMEIEVEAHRYNQIIYVNNASSNHTGWRNRDVSFYPTTKLFKKDETYVVYLSQVRTHQITTYFEPDMPYAALPCMYLPKMSADLGGPGSQYLAPELVGQEMPTYRYLQEVDLPTYDMNMALPLVNRGAVARAFDFPTADYVAEVAATIEEDNIRVYNYDFQVHTRTDALVGGKFDITLPTNADSTSYMIRKKDGSYEALTPHANMFGLNIATVTLADHCGAPFTLDVDTDGRPIVGEGPRFVVHALPPDDDLYGVQIVEVTDGSGGIPAPVDDGGDSGWNCN